MGGHLLARYNVAAIGSVRQAVCGCGWVVMTLKCANMHAAIWRGRLLHVSVGKARDGEVRMAMS